MHSIRVKLIEIVSYDLGNQSLPLMNIYIGHYISVIETVVISFIFLLFTTEVKIQLEQAKGQFIKEKCVENLTQSFSFFIFFRALSFSFFLSLIRRSSLGNWLHINLFLFFG